MKSQNFFKTKVLEILKKDKRVWKVDKFNKLLLFNLLEKNDKKIISLVLEDTELKKKFFLKIKDCLVFKYLDFKSCLETKNIDKSSTQFQNYIGLAKANDHKTNVHKANDYIKETKSVVLNWPYKDCLQDYVLQKTNDYLDKLFFENYQQKYPKKKSQEVFLNSILAKKEIEQLLSEKILINWRKYSKQSNQSLNKNQYSPVKTILKQGDLIRDNLIIKGNNLFALNCLKKPFANKIKLIYTDPPYNTGKNSFNYTDQFDHFSWLTFMKNRLEIAKELLRCDGVIMISCDDNEHAYLKVLMDEIFTKENFIVNLIWETKKGAQGIVTRNRVVNNHENILVYAKDKNQFKFNGLIREELGFANPDNDPRGKWKRQYLQRFGQGFSVKTICNPINGMNFSFETPYTLEKINQWIKAGTIIFPKKSHQYPARKEYLAEYKHNKQLVSSLGLFSTKASTETLYKLFDNQKIFRNPKPEKLIAFLIEQATQPKDIVLDYHLGSGTTCAVAHKMGRQYIGIEQMDYIEDIAVKRIQKVIAGEQGGVSKDYNFEGGGEFIYFELAKANKTLEKEIIACKNYRQLIKTFTEINQNYILHHPQIKELKEIYQKDTFKKLSLKKQKEVILFLINSQEIYINFNSSGNNNSINKLAVSKLEQKLNNLFY